MQKTSHRQFRLWMDWLDEQWNKPGLTEQYIAQLTREVHFTRRLKNPIKSLSSWFLKFTRQDAKPEPAPMTIEEATAAAKARWFAYTGFKPKK
jgi:hypothetical protein